MSAGASVSVTSELLPDPDTPVTTVNVPIWTEAVDVLQVVRRRADDRELRRVPGSRRASGTLDHALAR